MVDVSNLQTETTTKPKASNDDNIECEENTNPAVTNSSSILASDNPTTTLSTITESNVSSSEKSINLTNEEYQFYKPHVDDSFNQSNRPVTNRSCRGCGISCSNTHSCDMCGSLMHTFCGETIIKE